MTVTAFLLALGLTARATRFLNADVLAQPLRTWIDDRFGDESKIAYLIACPWCASPYLGALAVTWAYYAGDSPAFVIVASVATVSYLVGLTSINLDRQ